MMKTAIFAAAAACLFETTVAGLPTKNSVSIEEVNYTARDLGSKAGRAALERRIKAAATRVCAKYDLGSGATDRTVLRPCYQDAVEDARQQIKRAIAQHETSRKLNLH
jgi:UrcA family protein